MKESHGVLGHKGRKHDSFMFIFINGNSVGEF